MINEVLAQIGESSPDILGRSVDLPTITVDDVPDAAREAIGDALGITLDDNFGTFTVYDDGALSSAQEAVGLADKLVWVLVVLAPLAIAATIAISARRRRTLLQLTVGIALSMVLLRRLVFLFQKDLLDYVRVERNIPAVEATSEAFLDPLPTGALWVGIGALVIAAIATLTGPYPWAVRLREACRHRPAPWSPQPATGPRTRPRSSGSGPTSIASASAAPWSASSCSGGWTCRGSASSCWPCSSGPTSWWCTDWPSRPSCRRTSRPTPAR